jgi:hypothetical protein
LRQVCYTFSSLPHYCFLLVVFKIFFRILRSNLRNFSFKSSSRPNYSTKTEVPKSENQNVESLYSKYLAEHPLKTKAVTSAIIVCGGDVFAQTALEGKSFEDFNVRRSFNFALIGGLYIGPVLHYWYGYLFRKFPQQTATGAIQRLLADQFLFAPPFIPVFYALMLGLEGRISELQPLLRKQYIETLVNNWQLWIPAQFLNFRFVPVQHQVVFTNTVALAWNSWLSWSSHRRGTDNH